MNDPIPVSEALKLIEMALADCDHANRSKKGTTLARATMRPMLEYVRREIESVMRATDNPQLYCVEPPWNEYLPVSALRSHYDRVRDWRKS